MKIAYINYFYDENLIENEYLLKYHSIHGWCKGLADLGIKTDVFQRFFKNIIFKKDNVTYFLINDKKKHRLKKYQIPHLFNKKIAEGNYDVVHINGFLFIFQAYFLKKMKPTLKIVIQHHAEKPIRGIKKYFLKYFSSSIDGFIFASTGIYNFWIKTNSINKFKQYTEIMESSTHFCDKNRFEARKRTGLSGNPIFLWVGRLNENKDPITVLKGFLLLLNDFPNAKLYMIFSENKLEQELLSFINKTKLLKHSVRLLGIIDHNLMSNYYNSADYFVLGSHYEGSGYSLCECMACGVVPIVTDIPSFKTITNNGQIGGLWECGNAESLYKIGKEVLKRPLEIVSKKALIFFSTNLSYSAIALKAKLFYENLLKS